VDCGRNNMKKDVSATKKDVDAPTMRGDCRVVGYRYPFQEARFWLKRKGTTLASIHNTNQQSRKVVESIYKLGISFVMIPGGNEDDYSEQVFVLVEDATRDSVTSAIASMLPSARLFVEKLSVSQKDKSIGGTFIVADWSYSAKYGDRFFRCRREE
jgi:hypothetical protein